MKNVLNYKSETLGQKNRKTNQLQLIEYWVWSPEQWKSSSTHTYTKQKSMKKKRKMTNMQIKPSFSQHLKQLWTFQALQSHCLADWLNSIKCYAQLSNTVYIKRNSGQPPFFVKYKEILMILHEILGRCFENQGHHILKNLLPTEEIFHSGDWHGWSAVLTRGNTHTHPPTTPAHRVNEWLQAIWRGFPLKCNYGQFWVGGV